MTDEERMMIVREQLAKHVLDKNNNLISCLGAFVAVLRLYGGPIERDIAESIDIVIGMETTKNGTTH